MTNSAPIEVWEKILRYSIAVPLFFSSDPIVEHGYECLPRFWFEAEYWDSERTRNSCRRVCRYWDAFLQRYGHRYVRISDIYYGRIPLEVMSMAIRLNVAPEQGYEDINMFTAFNRTSALSSSYFTPTGKDRWSVKEWRMEILDGHCRMDLDQFIGRLKNAPRLRAVLTPGQTRPKATGLRFLSMNFTQADASSEPLVLQHLTTLQLRYHLISFEDWRLPSLQYLTIDKPFIYRDGFGDRLLEIVRAIGENLITLHFHGVAEDCPAPNIWPHIPHVERIQLPYWKGTLIPADHPARIVTISVADLGWFIKNGKGQPEMDLFNHLPHPKQFSSHCLTVRMDFTWIAVLMKQTLLRCCGSPSYHSIASAIWLAGYYEHLGVEFTDVEGVNLQDYLVFATKFYWKGRRASVPTRKAYASDPSDYSVVIGMSSDSLGIGAAPTPRPTRAVRPMAAPIATWLSEISTRFRQLSFLHR